jgi:hypothetical protein
VPERSRAALPETGKFLLFVDDSKKWKQPKSWDKKNISAIAVTCFVCFNRRCRAVFHQMGLIERVFPEWRT